MSGTMLHFRKINIHGEENQELIARFFYERMKEEAHAHHDSLLPCETYDAAFALVKEIFNRDIPGVILKGTQHQTLIQRGSKAIFHAYRTRRPGQDMDDLIKKAANTFFGFITETDKSTWSPQLNYTPPFHELD